MSLFVCRWQNGDFSAVSAGSRDEAIELLAEIGNAKGCELFAFDNFMVHFHTTSDTDNFEEMLPVRLGGFGEQTHRMLCERMYPTYCAAISEIDKDRPSLDDVLKDKLYAARELLNNALRIERNRQHAVKPSSVPIESRRPGPRPSE
ncbi:MAG TPA: hypothetical protein VMB18_09905 [Terriglobales bacterium]|jgi:hypothetical protein|nr:hypothetical protein [Terriglobales bacterium]